MQVLSLRFLTEFFPFFMVVYRTLSGPWWIINRNEEPRPTYKTEAMQCKYVNVSFAGAMDAIIQIFLNTPVDCYILLFLLSRSGHFPKYLLLCFNFKNFTKNSWLKNDFYSFVTQLLSYHSKAFKNNWGGGVSPCSSQCPPLLLSCSFSFVWYATPWPLCT